MQRRRLVQANFVGPAGYISMEDGGATGFVQPGGGGASLRQSNIYEPQRYLHNLSSILAESVDGKSATSSANFLVVRIMENGDTLLFASGRYVDRIALGPEPKYEERVVICDSRRF